MYIFRSLLFLSSADALRVHWLGDSVQRSLVDLSIDRSDSASKDMAQVFAMVMISYVSTACRYSHVHMCSSHKSANEKVSLILGSIKESSDCLPMAHFRQNSTECCQEIKILADVPCFRPYRDRCLEAYNHFVALVEIYKIIYWIFKSGQQLALFLAYGL